MLLFIENSLEVPFGAAGEKQCGWRIFELVKEPLVNGSYGLGHSASLTGGPDFG